MCPVSGPFGRKVWWTRPVYGNLGGASRYSWGAIHFEGTEGAFPVEYVYEKRGDGRWFRVEVDGTKLVSACCAHIRFFEHDAKARVFAVGCVSVFRLKRGGLLEPGLCFPQTERDAQLHWVIGWLAFSIQPLLGRLGVRTRGGYRVNHPNL